MNVMEEIAQVPVTQDAMIYLPHGLLGMEHLKRFAIVSNPEEEPFAWLEVIDSPALAFVILPPFVAVPDYAPDIPTQDVEFLNLEQPEDALIYNIVTLRADGSATINLKGPLILNRHTMRGKQVVLANASKYSVDHPLPTFN